MQKLSSYIVGSSRYMVFSFLLFLFLNNISFIAAPSLTTTRLTFLLVLFIIVLRSKVNLNIDNKGLLFFIFSIMLALYSAFISYSVGGDFIQFSRLTHFAFFSIFASFIVVYLIKDEQIFHELIVIATLIQVFFVVVTYTSPSFNNVLFSYVYSDGKFLSNLARAPGLSSTGGATLSVIIALGAFSVLRLSRLQKKSWHLVTLLIITLATVIVARTGLILCVLALLLYMPRVKLSIMPILVSLLSAIIFYQTLLELFLSNEQFVNYTLKWAISGLSGTDGTVNALFDMGLPDMSISEILFGSGLVSLSNGLNASGSDVGYIQTYYSLGVVFSVSFYLLFFIFLSSYLPKSKDQFFTFFLIVIMYVVEFKEPFIFKYALSFYVLICLLYSHKAGVSVNKLRVINE